jgi:hypothetical protein
MANNESDSSMSGAAATPNQHAPMTQLMDEKATAALLHVSVKALQGWRSRGGGPRFVKVGRCVRYRPEDLQAFVVAALRTSTSDPGAPPPSRSRIRVEPLLEKTGRALGRGAAAPALPPGKPR